MQPGVLSDGSIKRLIESGIIKSEEPIDLEKQLSASTLDFSIGNIGYRIAGSVLPKSREKVQDLIKKFNDGFYHFDMVQPMDCQYFLEPGCIYIFELNEMLNLPESIRAKANPKSSIGRLDVLVRLICDGNEKYDYIPAGYRGNLYLEICPLTFPVRLGKGSRFCQVRFYSNHAFSEFTADKTELDMLHNEFGLVFDKRGRKIKNPIFDDNALRLSVDLNAKIIAYRGKKQKTKAVDVDKSGEYKLEDFWEMIKRQDDKSLIIGPDEFYILKSKEKIRVPLGYAAEIVPQDETLGEYRVHYAGYVHPGFGYGKKGEVKGTHLIFEVKARDVPAVLRDGRVLAKVYFQKMRESPENSYNAGYQKQQLMVSRHFKNKKKS